MFDISRENIIDNDLKEIVHIPVLKKEVICSLNLKKNGCYVDCTFGSGGHSREIILNLSRNGRLVSFDCDYEAYSRCQKIFSSSKNFSLINDDFSNLDYHLQRMQINSVDGFVFDLGLSSEQISSNRGFSRRNENDSLDMRMNNSGSLTASEIINRFSERELADIFFFYGEERFSRRIAKSIRNLREKEPIIKVHQLVRLVTSCLPLKKKKLKHPAKKVFQALRIAVNDELRKLDKALESASKLLSYDSSLIVISYHSLEDRIVKRFFKSFLETNSNFSCSKKPITPSEEEINFNNRARSAKMRVLSRLPKNLVSE